MRRLLVCLALAAACTAQPPPPAVQVRPVVTQEPTQEPSPAPLPQVTFGGDISWPSCPVGTPGALPKKQGKGLPLPGPDAQFVVIGLTDGPGFYPNPCLPWEVQQARRRGLLVAAYALTTLPNAAQIKQYGGSGPYRTRLENAAWQQAQVNLRSLKTAGLPTRTIWMDVEPQPYLSPWGDDVAANRTVVLTVRDAYRKAGYATGLYSSDTPWLRITGGLQLPDPTWVTVGPRGRAAAISKCAAPTFSGGPAVLAQWWDTEVEDLDLVCPGVDGRGLFSTFAG